MTAEVGRRRQTSPLARDGRLAIDAAGHQIYYRIFGTGRQTLLGLHGGPGASHRYLERLAEVAGNDLKEANLYLACIRDWLERHV